MKPAFVIVGLGNPGKQYEKTRHNIGFLAVDYFAEQLKAGEWKDAQKFLCTAAEAEFNGVSVLLVKPTTYMNLSGQSIRKLVDFYKLDPAKQILVCADELDLPLGTFRLRMTGGPGTHNGLKSIVETLGENFPRLRIGFGPQPKDFDLAAWVLSALTKEESESLKKTISESWAEVQKLIKE